MLSLYLPSHQVYTHTFIRFRNIASLSLSRPGPLSLLQGEPAADQALAVERVQREPVGPVAEGVHTGPVGSEAGDDGGGAPGEAAVGAGRGLELAAVDAGAAAGLVGHEGGDEGAADVDDLGGAGVVVVDGLVDAAARVPAVAVVRGEDVVDGEGAGLRVFEDAAVGGRDALISQGRERGGERNGRGCVSFMSGSLFGRLVGWMLLT